MKKQLRLVLLPTKGKSNLAICNNDYLQDDDDDFKNYVQFGIDRHHLYAISDEKPKVGDYYQIFVKGLHSKPEIAKLLQSDVDSGLYEKWKDSCKKVIITTDESLTYCQCGNNPHKMSCKQTYNFPTFTNDFINTYIERYNNDDPILKVNAEYKTNNIHNQEVMYHNEWKQYFFEDIVEGEHRTIYLEESLKVNPDNSVDVSLIENDCICRICNNTAIISKGVMNLHDVRTSDHTKEFITKVVDCYKCSNCGHSWIPLQGLNEEDKLYTKEEIIKFFSLYQYDLAQHVLNNEPPENRPIPVEWIRTKL